jgi:hypothetical protein
MSLNDEDRQYYDAREKAVRDQKSLIVAARNDALRDGQLIGKKLGEDRGVRRTLQEVVEMELSKFGQSGLSLMDAVRKIEEVSRLKALYKAIRNATTLQEVQELVNH